MYICYMYDVQMYTNHWSVFGVYYLSNSVYYYYHEMKGNYLVRSEPTLIYSR